MSHTVILEFKCNEGVGPGFLETLLGALADTRAFEGCENVEVYTDADDPDRIVLWEKWTTREDQEAYLAWRTETGMMEMIASMMAEPPRFMHLEPQD
jgi:quinol monooxygenase YgiN